MVEVALCVYNYSTKLFKLYINDVNRNSIIKFKVTSKGEKLQYRLSTKDNGY